MIILAFDALDLSLIKKFNCKNLMQLDYGKTDISEFSLERTVVLWASFLSGKNMEKKIPIKNQWSFRLKKNETFFKFFNSFEAIDVPAFSFKQENHEIERNLLKGYFQDRNSIEDYDEAVWKNHEENKSEFLASLGNAEIVMGYFGLADAIGHLSFGDLEKMKVVYEELDSITKEVKKSKDFTLIVSDHGMKAVGRYGDHTKNGFYSCNRRINLELPKITDFFNLIKEMKNE
jgi:hypothetical protein